MWIDPFWFGVMITIVIEMVVIAVAGFVMMRREERENGKAQSNGRRNFKSVHTGHSKYHMVFPSWNTLWLLRENRRQLLT